MSILGEGSSSPYASDWSIGAQLGATGVIYVGEIDPALVPGMLADGWEWNWGFGPQDLLDVYFPPPTIAVADPTIPPASPPMPSPGPDLPQTPTDVTAEVPPAEPPPSASPEPPTFAGPLTPEELGSLLGEEAPPTAANPPIYGITEAIPLPRAPETTGGAAPVSIFSDINWGDLAGSVIGDLFGSGGGTFGTGTTNWGGLLGDLTNLGSQPVAAPGPKSPTMPAPSAGQPTRMNGYHWSSKRGKWIKNRRQNPLNVHALRRALRRAEGFIRIEKRVDKIVNRAARYAGRARHHGFVRSKARK